MSRAKLLIAACFAVLALSALTVATASAAEGWDVAGTALPTNSKAAIKSPANVGQKGLLEVALGEGTITIKCEANTVSITGGALVGPTGIEATSVGFEECFVVNNETCNLGQTTINTVPIHGVAKLDPASPLNTLILVLPKTKNTFATILFIGNTCALKGVQPVTGDVDLLVDAGVHATTVHLVLVSSLPKSLKVGNSEASLHKLDADVQLVSGSTWNFL